MATIALSALLLFLFISQSLAAVVPACTRYASAEFSTSVNTYPCGATVDKACFGISPDTSFHNLQPSDTLCLLPGEYSINITALESPLLIPSGANVAALVPPNSPLSSVVVRLAPFEDAEALIGRSVFTLGECSSVSTTSVIQGIEFNSWRLQSFDFLDGGHQVGLLADCMPTLVLDQVSFVDPTAVGDVSIVNLPRGGLEVSRGTILGLSRPLRFAFTDHLTWTDSTIRSGDSSCTIGTISTPPSDYYAIVYIGSDGIELAGQFEASRLVLQSASLNVSDGSSLWVRNSTFWTWTREALLATGDSSLTVAQSSFLPDPKYDGNDTLSIRVHLTLRQRINQAKGNYSVARAVRNYFGSPYGPKSCCQDTDPSVSMWVDSNVDWSFFSMDPNFETFSTANVSRTCAIGACKFLDTAGYTSYSLSAFALVVVTFAIFAVDLWANRGLTFAEVDERHHSADTNEIQGLLQNSASQIFHSQKAVLTYTSRVRYFSLASLLLSWIGLVLTGLALWDPYCAEKDVCVGLFNRDQVIATFSFLLVDTLYSIPPLVTVFWRDNVNDRLTRGKFKWLLFASAISLVLASSDALLLTVLNIKATFFNGIVSNGYFIVMSFSCFFIFLLRLLAVIFAAKCFSRLDSKTLVDLEAQINAYSPHTKKKFADVLNHPWIQKHRNIAIGVSSASLAVGLAPMIVLFSTQSESLKQWWYLATALGLAGGVCLVFIFTLVACLRYHRPGLAMLAIGVYVFIFFCVSAFLVMVGDRVRRSGELLPVDFSISIVACILTLIALVVQAVEVGRIRSRAVGELAQEVGKALPDKLAPAGSGEQASGKPNHEKYGATTTN